MKNFAKRVSALVLALVVGAAALCPAAFAAASLPDLPKDECVVDDANILSDSTTQTIIDLNAQLESKLQRGTDRRTDCRLYGQLFH